MYDIYTLAYFISVLIINTISWIEINSFDELVIAQGKVTEEAKPHDSNEIWLFETKNIIKRVENNNLKIWKVIYNAAPANT